MFDPLDPNRNFLQIDPGIVRIREAATQNPVAIAWCSELPDVPNQFVEAWVLYPNFRSPKAENGVELVMRGTKEPCSSVFELQGLARLDLVRFNYRPEDCRFLVHMRRDFKGLPEEWPTDAFRHTKAVR